MYHLDHRIPITYGFKNGINPIIMSHRFNLQMLPAKENLIKRDKLECVEYIESMLYNIKNALKMEGVKL